MSIPWATVPREPVLDEVVGSFGARADGGVALLGVDGVGKTTLAAQIAERLGQPDPPASASLRISQSLRATT